MNARLTVFNRISFSLRVLPLINRYRLWINLLYLLVVKHEIDLQDELLFFLGYFGLNPKMHDIVELHFLLVVSEEECPGHEGRSLWVYECLLDDLRVAKQAFLLVVVIVLSMGERISIHSLHSNINTSFGCLSPS